MIDMSQVASKEDVFELKKEILRFKAEMFKWSVPLLLGQAAVIAAFVKLL